MTFLAKLLFSLVGINALLLMISLGYHRPLPRELPELPNIATRTDPYRFLDHPLAFQVLSKLDVFNETLSPASVFNTSYLGFKIDDNYCEKQRAYFVEYPEAAFEEVNLVHSFGINSFVAQAISPVANDIHGAHTSKLSRIEKESFILDVKPETTVFFTTRSLSSFYTLTKHVSCLFQESNQIPGQSKFSLKDLVARASSEYVKKFEGRSHCINHDKYFPKTWLLNDPQECKEFFENLMSPEYTRLKEERKIVYIKKFPAEHRGIGVIPLNSIEEQNLRKQYKNGTLCGQIPKIIVMQHYIHNSLLLHGHKFDFRMYMLIASVNPLIAYYHDGFLRVTLAEYDASSTDKKVLLTNLALNEQIYDDASKGILYKGQTEEDLKQAQQWSFDRLQAYLLVVGVIKDPNWLDNYLRPELKKAMIHLVRLSSDNFGIHSSFYGLYGVDFMLDTDLNLWFIESNSGPAFDGYSEPMGKFVGKMLTDHLEIVIGLLRSRMKRTINFVNKLIQERVVYEVTEGEVVIENLEETRKEFERITMNYFEKEFEVSEGNGFAKIIDENEQGENVYQGWIDTDCLNF